MKIADIMKIKSKVNYMNFTMDMKYSKSNFFPKIAKNFPDYPICSWIENHENHIKGILLPFGQTRLLIEARLSKTDKLIGVLKLL